MMAYGPALQPTCSVEGCNLRIRERGRSGTMCRMHHARFITHGDPLRVAPSGPPPGTHSNGAFPCTTCGGRTAVKDSRPHESGGIRRRRECMLCSSRFTTIEVATEDAEEAKALADSTRKNSLIRKFISIETLMSDILDELQGKSE